MRLISLERGGRTRRAAEEPIQADKTERSGVMRLLPAPCGQPRPAEATSPIVLSDRPDRKRCTAYECRMQWAPWNGMASPLRFDQAWKASVTAGGLRTPAGVRQRRNSSR